MTSEGFTRVKVRLEGSTRIVIPMEWELLLNMENVDPSLGPLCSNMEGATLDELDDATPSRSISVSALRVSLPTFLLNSVLHTSFLLVVYLWFFLDRDFGNSDCPLKVEA